MRRLVQTRRSEIRSASSTPSGRRIDVASLRAGAERRTQPGPCNRRCDANGRCAFGRAPEHLPWCRDAAGLRPVAGREVGDPRTDAPGIGGAA